MTVQFLGVTVEFFGWYFNAHLLKHDFCSQFSRLADKETAEGRHLLSPSGITEPKLRAFSMTRSCRVNSSPPVEQFHFLFRSRGLGKRGILFPFPVHVSQRGGKYYFRFRWKFGGKGSTRDTEEGLLRQGPSRTRGDCGAAGLRLFYHYCHQSSTFGWTFQNLFMQHYISMYDQFGWFGWYIDRFEIERGGNRIICPRAE